MQDVEAQHQHCKTNFETSVRPAKSFGRKHDLSVEFVEHSHYLFHVAGKDDVVTVEQHGKHMFEKEELKSSSSM